MSDDLFNLIYNKSLDLLSRREHSRKEIKDKPLGTFVREVVGPIALSRFIKNNNIPHKVLPFAQFNPVGKFNFDFIQTYHYGTGNWGGGL